MRYIPSEGRVIIYQEKAKKQGLLYIPEESRQANQYAEIVATTDDKADILHKRIFFDIGYATIISDTDDGRYSVLDIDNILCFVQDE